MLSAGRTGRPPHVSPVQSRTTFTVLAAVAGGHFINDLLQSLLPAIYPILKDEFRLDFWQIGLITLANQMTASLLQPVVGYVFDRRPHAHSLAAGMALTLIGLILLAFASNYGWLIVAAALVGIGSSVFHPEASRVARLASGGQHGLAQSLFQTGGNGGSALGPLAATFIVLPLGQTSVAWFAVLALVGIALLWRVGRWYGRTAAALPAGTGAPRRAAHDFTPRQVRVAMTVLVALVVSKSVYIASLTNFSMVFLMERFDVSVRVAQLHLFGFLAAVAVGTFAGGPIGDRIGRKAVIWVSILGVLPFTLLLPWASLFWTGVLAVLIGLVLSSAFSAILVYAQELLPGRVGLVAGLFFGLAFGIGGLAAAGLGRMADLTSLETVYRLCALLPALGLLTALLPSEPKRARVAR
ncbi:MAG: MFS transporter [Acidobacteria bacterium]|nr:MFS transporter [Acidobacteriota bacterium]